MVFNDADKVLVRPNKVIYFNKLPGLAVNNMGFSDYKFNFDFVMYFEYITSSTPKKICWKQHEDKKHKDNIANVKIWSRTSHLLGL